MRIYSAIAKMESVIFQQVRRSETTIFLLRFKRYRWESSMSKFNYKVTGKSALQKQKNEENKRVKRLKGNIVHRSDEEVKRWK